jgi:pSer/pThr/pTyr-binding forkhead associated (FHA) protein
VQGPAELADQALAVHVDDLADERGTMAVHAAEAAGAQRAYAVAEERDLHEGIAVPAEREHGLSVFRGGHRDPSIDPVPKIGGGRMEERMSDAENTGPLDVGGTQAPPLSQPEQPERRGRPAWVEDARAGLAVPGKYLAYEESGRHVVVTISREWTRIGRSMAADLRFDDATVSRRHALVVNQAEGVRVLDDRSLNGIYVNGRRVEWSPLADGDEVTIGRHTLFFMDTVTAGSPVAAPAVTSE